MVSKETDGSVAVSRPSHTSSSAYRHVVFATLLIVSVALILSLMTYQSHLFNIKMLPPPRYMYVAGSGRPTFVSGIFGSGHSPFQLATEYRDVWISDYPKLILGARKTLLQQQRQEVNNNSLKYIKKYNLFENQFSKGVTTLYSLNKTNGKKIQAIVVSVRLATGDFGGIWLHKERYFKWTVSNVTCDKGSSSADFCHKNTDVRNSVVPIPPDVLKNDTIISHDYSNWKATDVYISLHPDGIIHGDYGDVISRGVCYMSRQCNLRSSHTTTSFPKGLRGIMRYTEVFVLTQHFGYAFFHWNIENLSRISFYLPFLLANRHIKIHVPLIHDGVVAQMSILGFERRRLVTGHIQSLLVYLPQGGGCGMQLQFNSVTLLHSIYLNYLSRVNPPSTHRRNLIVLIQRSKKRTFQQHEQIADMLRNITQEYKLEFRVFSDSPPPNLNETMTVFNRALLVVAPHGAGLSNLIYSQGGTAVIEGMCGHYNNYCFQRLSFALGLRYHLVKAKGCSEMIVDLSHVQKMVTFYLDNMN